MRVVQVNPFDHWVSEVDSDGYWHETNPLPVDEWRCSGCSEPVGYLLRENSYGSTLDWYMMFIPVGSDPLKDDTPRWCEECVQDHEVVET